MGVFPAGFALAGVWDFGEDGATLGVVLGLGSEVVAQVYYGV